MITEELFRKRLLAFYSSWESHKHLWGYSDIIVASNLNSSSSSSSRDFLLWLLGEDVTGTTAVFTPSSIVFLCTQESFSRLRSLGSYAFAMRVNIPISVELKPRNYEGVSKKLDKIFQSRRDVVLRVGCIDPFEGEIPNEYFSKYTIACVNRGVRELIGQGQGSGVTHSRINKDDDIAMDKQKLPPASSFLGNREKLKLKIEQRLTFLYSSWRKYRKELWGDSDALVVTTPPSPSPSSASGTITMAAHPVSSSFFLWLLGRHFPNTKAVFMDKEIYFFCAIESYPYFIYLQRIMTTAQLPVSVRPKFRADEEDSEMLNSSTLYAAAAALWRTRSDRAANNDHPDPVIIGYIGGETPNSKEVVHSCCGCVCVAVETRFQAINVISGFLKLLKEEGEVGLLLLLKSLQISPPPPPPPPPQSYNKAEENYEEEQVTSSLSSSASSMVSNEDEDNRLQSKFAEMDINVVEGGRSAFTQLQRQLQKKKKKKKMGQRVRSSSSSSSCRNASIAEQVVLTDKEQEESESTNVGIENGGDYDRDWEIIDLEEAP